MPKLRIHEKKIQRLRAYVPDHKPSRRDYHRDDPRNLGIRNQAAGDTNRKIERI